MSPSDAPVGPPSKGPAYNPSILVLDVMAALGRAGIETSLDAAQALPAQSAAADLLRALGVNPDSAPMR